MYDDFKEIVSKAIRTDLGSGEASAEETVQTFDCDRVYVASGSDAIKSVESGSTPRTVCITNDNKAALEEWDKGESVLLFVKPDSTLPGSTLKGEYCTDFWCYPMFRAISEGAGKPVPVGTMGLLIDAGHPALAGFACDRHALPSHDTGQRQRDHQYQANRAHDGQLRAQSQLRADLRSGAGS